MIKKCQLFGLIFLSCVLLPCYCQRAPFIPVKADSFKQYFRTAMTVPNGRRANLKDTLLRLYSNSTVPSSYRLRKMKQLTGHPSFDVNKPTVIYAHGYVELATDNSVQTVVSAYRQNGGYNVVVLDWANLAFGNYLLVAMDISALGKETAVALHRLIKRGLPAESIHLVGHSLGAHLLAYASRFLAAKGIKISRLTGLDPAYPGFYPPVLGRPISKSDATFVDVIHTDAGGFGAPGETGHADFWPNEGDAKQPGCLSATLPFTVEDLSSHWRSWGFWAESVNAGEFLARKCDSYDSFLRGQCRDHPRVYMGLRATPELRGNFYLRTAAFSPYALGQGGVD